MRDAKQPRIAPKSYLTDHAGFSLGEGLGQQSANRGLVCFAFEASDPKPKISDRREGSVQDSVVIEMGESVGNRSARYGARSFPLSLGPLALISLHHCEGA